MPRSSSCMHNHTDTQQVLQQLVEMMSLQLQLYTQHPLSMTPQNTCLKYLQPCNHLQPSVNQCPCRSIIIPQCNQTRFKDSSQYAISFLFLFSQSAHVGGHLVDLSALDLGQRHALNLLRWQRHRGCLVQQSLRGHGRSPSVKPPHSATQHPTAQLSPLPPNKQHPPPDVCRAQCCGTPHVAPGHQ